MKSLVLVLTLLVTILGVISKDLPSSGNDDEIEEPEMLADGNILDLVFDRKGSKPACNKWKTCCLKCRAQEQHYGLVVTGGDNPDRIASSAQISSMGVCVSPNTNIPNLPTAIAGAKSVWIEKSKTLMFCGGSDTFGGKQIQTCPDGWGALNTCYRLTPGDTVPTWEDNSKYYMQFARGWFSLNNVNRGKIGAVAAGGSGPGCDNVLDTIENFYDGKWRLLKNKKGEAITLDNPTYGHCAVTFNKGKQSFLMIIGGSHNGANFDEATDAVTIINLNTGKNKHISNSGLPALWAPACVINKGKYDIREYIYVSGGGGGGSAFNTVYKGRIDGKFRIIAFLGLNNERSGHTMGVTFDGPESQMFVAGGYNPSATAGSEYLTDIITGTTDGKSWTEMNRNLTEGGEYAAMASVPAFTFKCVR